MFASSFFPHILLLLINSLILFQRFDRKYNKALISVSVSIIFDLYKHMPLTVTKNNRMWSTRKWFWNGYNEDMWKSIWNKSKKLRRKWNEITFSLEKEWQKKRAEWVRKVKMRSRKDKFLCRIYEIVSLLSFAVAHSSCVCVNVHRTFPVLSTAIEFAQTETEMAFTRVQRLHQIMHSLKIISSNVRLCSIFLRLQQYPEAKARFMWEKYDDEQKRECVFVFYKLFSSRHLEMSSSGK